MVVPDCLNLPSMYLIHISIVQSSYLRCILRICMAAGPLPEYLRSFVILLRYLLLRTSDLLCVNFLPKYAD